MPVRFKQDGGTWEFDSLDEAIAFRDSRGLTQPPHKPAPTPQRAPATLASEHPNSHQKQIHKVLVALAQAEPKGLLGDDIAPIAGLKGSRGMAGLAASVRDFLKNTIGRDDVDTVFWNEKRPGRPAVWHVNPDKLREFIAFTPGESS